MVKCFIDFKEMGKKKNYIEGLPDSSVVKTLHFHCRGHRFIPWLGN